MSDRFPPPGSGPHSGTPSRIADLAPGQPRQAPSLRDAIAGISVALVVIPQSLAYADLAGMPAEQGLYASALPPLVAAVFACSPYLQTGAVAITSLLTFGALTTQAPPGSPHYIELGLLLALLVGAIRLTLGIARVGAIAYLMSRPLVLGFTAAAAALIILAQLPTALGATPAADGIILAAAEATSDPMGWSAEAIVLAAGSLALVLGGVRVHPLFPGVLVAVAIGISFSYIVGYDGLVVGEIRPGLPPISLSLPWGDVPALLIPALVIALVGFAEPAAIARTFAARDRQSWDPDRELVSQGGANVAAGLSGGFPVGGSFSRSALNRFAGAQSRWSGAVTGLFVLAFLPFAGALARLPTAVLAAIVIAAVVHLLRLGPIFHLLPYSRPQFAVAAGTFALTIALSPHVERAILIGVALSVAIHLWRELRIEVAGWSEGERELHLRPRGVLWFGSAARLEDDFIRFVARHPRANHIVVHLDGLGRVDTTGALALRALRQQVRDAGLGIEFVDVRPRWRRLVDRLIEAETDPIGS